MKITMSKGKWVRVNGKVRRHKQGHLSNAGMDTGLRELEETATTNSRLVPNTGGGPAQRPMSFDAQDVSSNVSLARLG